MKNHKVIGMKLNFDDEMWMTSQGGFGYGDGDDGTIIGASNFCLF